MAKNNLGGRKAPVRVKTGTAAGPAKTKYAKSAQPLSNRAVNSKSGGKSKPRSV